VEQAAELPGLMRSTVERQRAVIERGTIHLRPLAPVDFMDAGDSAWPDIDAYTVTRAREDATVWVESNKGDPVIASQAFGLGRVVAVTTSVPEWTPGWADWPSWPRLAAGLLDYVSRRPMHSKLWLGTESDADSMAVTVDYAEGTDWAGEAEGRLLVTPPAGPEFAVELRSVAPGRLAATLENPLAGVYRFMAEIGADRVGSYQLHRVPGELERIGANPELERWESEGLLRRWKGDGKEALAAESAGDRERDRRSWTLLAVALFLLGVLVDRVDLNGSAGTTRLRALWRRQLSAPAP
jgi:hypothetical protein